MASFVKIEIQEEENKPQTKKERKKELMKGSIFITWFMISLSIFFIAADLQNGHIVVMNFGQYILVFGVLAYNASKDKLTLIAPVVGLGCIIIPLLMMIGPENINWEIVIPMIALTGFILVGLGFLLFPIVNRLKLKKQCSVSVNATILKHDIIKHKSSSNRLKTLYAPTYSYTYNGKEYKVKSQTYTDANVKQIGNMIELKINPENPSMILEPINIDIIVPVCMGIVMLIFTIFIFILFINQNF